MKNTASISLILTLVLSPTLTSVTALAYPEFVYETQSEKVSDIPQSLEASESSPSPEASRIQVNFDELADIKSAPKPKKEEKCVIVKSKTKPYKLVAHCKEK